MTTQPLHEGSGSARWTAVDTAGTAQRESAILDVSWNWPVAVLGREASLKLLDLKPGQQVLEVGPGTGAFAQEMAALVGASGHVTGVDVNASMAAVATERAVGSGLPLTFQQGDVHHLDFPDGAFDACFAQAVFPHIEDPEKALREMVRVTRPGGRIVLRENDSATTIFDAPDVEASRIVVDSYSGQFRDGSRGRKLPRMFKEAGLTEVVVETISGAGPATRAEEWARHPFAAAVQRVVQEGKLTQERADAWIASLDRASQEGHFLIRSMWFVVAGTRP